MRRTLVILFALVVLIAALTAAAVLASGGDRAVAASSAVSLTVTPSVAHRGQVVLIHGSAGSCPFGDRVTIISRAFVRTHEFAGVPAALAKVRSGGGFQVTTKVRRRLRAHLFVVTARCGGGNLGVSAHLSVLP